MKLVIVILILLAVALLLRILKLVVKRIGENSRWINKVDNIEPLFGLVVWLIAVFWAVYYLFYDKNYYNFIVFALIGLLVVAFSWFFVKDFMAGILFKTQNNFVPGEVVQLMGVSGKLRAMLLTHVSIYTDDGEVVKIPYSKVSGEIISKKSVSGQVGCNYFEIKVPKKEELETYLNLFEKILLASPWRIKDSKPDVKLKSETDDFYVFEIHFEARSEKHLKYVADYLRKRIKEAV